MATNYTPARAANLSASIAYTATRYAGSLTLCAAIRAAAETAPEYRPDVEFPERYRAGFYPDASQPAEHEAGAEFWCGDVSQTVVNGQRIGRDMRVRIISDGPACKWPRVNVKPETMGPYLPMPADARAVFAYATPDGARGSLTVANTRGALLSLADKVHANRGAFDGKAKRAAKPSKPTSSAPHVAARAMWEAFDYAGALQLAGNVSALYFGHAGQSGAPFPYMAAEPADLHGVSFTLARSIQSGRFRVMHTASGLSVDSVTSGAPQSDGFKTQTAALAWIESAMAERAFRDRIAAAAGKVAPFDQSAALAFYMAADATPEAIEAAPSVQTAPADTLAAGTGPDGATGPEFARPVQEKTTRAAIDAARLSAAIVAAAEAAPVIADAGPIVTARHVGPAEFARTVAVAQLRAAAATLARASLLFAPDFSRSHALSHARSGNLSAAPAILAHLQRIAERGETADLRNDAAEEVRALADAMAEHARESAPPATQSHAEAAPPATQSHAPAAVFRYALVNRPAHMGAIPRGLEYSTEPRPERGAPHYEMARHGILTCARVLTDAECISFELARLLDDSDVSALAQTIAADLTDYAAEYLAQAADEPDEFSRAVWQRVARQAVRVSLAEPDAFAARVAECLRGAMPPATQSAPVAAPPATQSEPATDAAYLRDWCTRATAEADTRRTLAAALAAGAEFPDMAGGSVRFRHGDSRVLYGIAGPDMSGVDAFRFTYFDDAGPVGHAGASSLAAACLEALQRGYVAIPADADPVETPAPRYAIPPPYSAEHDGGARPCTVLHGTGPLLVTRRRAAYLLRAGRSRRADNVQRTGLHAFTIADARLRIETARAPEPLSTQSERFEAAAVRAESIGNDRRAEVLRELAAESVEPPPTQPSAPTYGIAAGIEPWQIASAQSRAVYSTPVYRIGKHEWATIVYAHPQYGACTDHVWRRVDQNRGIFRRANEWPRYNSDDTFSGLPRSLGDKVFEPNRAAIETALADVKAGRFAAWVPESTRETARRGVTARAEWDTRIESVRKPTAVPAPLATQPAPGFSGVLAELARRDAQATPPATQPDALRAQIDAMHPNDVYDLIADNGYETDATRYLSIDGQRAALETIARQVGARAFGGMVAKLAGDDEPPATQSEVAPEMLAAPPAEIVIDWASLPPATQSGPFRISARNSAARENRGVHVLFSANRDRSGPCVGFYMSAQTYRAIPLDVEATPADYERFGVLEPAPDGFSWGPYPAEAAPAISEPEAADLRERARAAVAGPTPSLRIPAGDPRTRIPARFAPVYLLRGGSL